MVNSSKTAQHESTYIFQLSRHYKIWFSQDPDVFLGIENELRLVRMREKNPNAVIHLIYSSKCLSNLAITQLHQFCEQQAIIPIEFEGISAELEDQNDKEIFAIANEEIQRCLDKTGGNMAAASDCARLIRYLIEKLGIYSDFDVESFLSKLESDFVCLQGPMLFPANRIVYPDGNIVLDVNSDFLAFSRDERHPERLSQAALRAIGNVQKILLSNYRRPFSWNVFFPDIKMKDYPLYPELTELFRDFNEQFPKHPSIYDFRVFLSNLPDELPKQGQPESVKLFLFRSSVMLMSGPSVYRYAGSDLFPKGVTRLPTLIPSIIEWLPYLDQYKRCGIGYYDALYDLIKSNNKLRYSSESSGSGKQEPVCDKSWLQEGMLAKKEREASMLKATSVIQTFWRKAHSQSDFVHNMLLVRIKKICTEASLITCLQEKSYAQAFRKACAGLKLPVVKLMLQYRERGLMFDINEPSSNGNTALDWVLSAKPKKKEQLNIQKELATLLSMTMDEPASQSCTFV